MKNLVNNIYRFLKAGGLIFVFFLLAIVMHQRPGYITLIGAFCVLTFFNVSIKYVFSRETFLILAYVFFYILFSHFNGQKYDPSTLVLYALAPMFFFQFGEELVRRFSDDLSILKAWTIILICYAIDVIILIISDIATTGSIIGDARLLEFDGDGTYVVSATRLGLSLSIAMVGFPMCIIVRNRILKCVFLLISSLSLIGTFYLLNRTAIVIALMVIIFIIGYKFKHNLKALFCAISAFLIIFMIMRYLGIINEELISLYSDRNADISTMGDRTGRWLDAIILFASNPFGWAMVNEDYVHNMWLDIAKISGVIPFSLLVYITSDTIISSLKLLHRKETEFAYMLLGLNICFFASCFVEPIYGGTHFLLYLMLWGTEKQLLRSNFV